MAKRTNRVAWGLVVVLICTSASEVQIKAQVPDQDQDPAAPIWTYKDPWYRAFPRELGRSLWSATEREKWMQVRDDELARVSPRMRPAAEKRLEKVSIVKLTIDEAQPFTEKKLTLQKGKSPHLVRAVGLGERFGGFTAAYRDDLLSISFGCLGKRPEPMTRQPLVIFLPTTPKQVFVTCWMAE